MRTKGTKKEKIGKEVTKLLRNYYTKVGDKMFEQEDNVVQMVYESHAKRLMEKYDIPEAGGFGTSVVRMWILDSFLKLWMKKKVKV